MHFIYLIKMYLSKTVMIISNEIRNKIEQLILRNYLRKISFFLLNFKLIRKIFLLFENKSEFTFRKYLKVAWKDTIER